MKNTNTNLNLVAEDFLKKNPFMSGNMKKAAAELITIYKIPSYRISEQLCGFLVGNAAGMNECFYNKLYLALSAVSNKYNVNVSITA